MTANRFKFRAWDVKHNQMSDTFMIFDDKRIEAIHDKGLDENAEGLLVIMQSTGLTDKNGKEIFEGDRIKPPRGRIEAVEYGGGGFNPFAVPHWEVTPEPSECEVIGNIYENPELIKAR